MTTFIAPTYRVPYGREEPKEWSLFRYYDGFEREYVVIIDGGTPSTYPGLVSPSTSTLAGADSGSGENGLAIFRGGRSYEISASEESALNSAGYTSEVT